MSINKLAVVFVRLQVWQQVKAANPGFSICEIGATIGRMWRELSDEEKQRHMEDFTKDKVDTHMIQNISNMLMLLVVIFFAGITENSTTDVAICLARALNRKTKKCRKVTIML